MTPEGSPSPPGNAHAAGALRFILVFAAITLGLLAGYRYAIGTSANDWYLFQVARHTAVVLDVIGYRADLEKTTGSGLRPAVVRAALRGEEPVPPATKTDAEPPLSPWEIWQYRARQDRNDPGSTRVLGPQVLFVLTPGLQHEVAALERRLAALDQEDAGTSERASDLEDRIQTLRQDQAAGLADPARRREQQGRFFSFIVIPECGAIEVMVIFLAAVIAFPTRWSVRLWGLGLGLPILYGVNILRLACLAIIGAIDRTGQWFEFFHHYVWQAGYVLFVAILWMAWVELGVRRPPE